MKILGPIGEAIEVGFLFVEILIAILEPDDDDEDDDYL